MIQLVANACLRMVCRCDGPVDIQRGAQEAVHFVAEFATLVVLNDAGTAESVDDLIQNEVCDP